MSWIENRPGGCRLCIRVTPRSSRNKVDGLRDGALKIRLCAPPVEGKANAVLVEFLSEQLGVSRRAVQLVSGQQGRHKLIEVSGISAETAAARLQTAQANASRGE